MFDRYKDHNRFDSREALFLARKVGSDLAEGKLGNLQMVVKQLFEGYARVMQQPINNVWHRLPDLTELVQAASDAYETVAGQDKSKGKAQIAKLLSSEMRNLHVSIMPRLLVLFKDDDLHPDFLQKIATELMQLRQEAVIATSRIRKGVVFSFTNFMADRRAEALHTRYLNDLPNGDICHALAIVAEKTRQRATNADGEALKDQLFDQAARLVKTARMFGGSERPATWFSLSQTETYAEDHATSKRFKLATLQPSG
jgi:hypothetical protein